jgi:hypothetical protein
MQRTPVMRKLVNCLICNIFQVVLNEINVENSYLLEWSVSTPY